MGNTRAAFQRHAENPRHTGNLVSAFDEIVAELQKLETLPNLSAVIDELLPASDDAVSDLRDLAVDALNEIGDEDRAEWLIRLMEAISKPEVPTEINEVKIMSLHKSKGLNAPVTIIAGCVEGLLPSSQRRELLLPRQRLRLKNNVACSLWESLGVKAEPALGKPGTLILTYPRHMPLAVRWARVFPRRGVIWRRSIEREQICSRAWSSCSRPVAG